MSRSCCGRSTGESPMEIQWGPERAARNSGRQGVGSTIPEAGEFGPKVSQGRTRGYRPGSDRTTQVYCDGMARHARLLPSDEPEGRGRWGGGTGHPHGRLKLDGVTG